MLRTDLLGTITQDERDQIKRIYMRKMALVELVSSLGNTNNDLYEKVLADLAQAAESMESWWDAVQSKYGWKVAPGAKWYADFQKCQVSALHEEQGRDVLVDEGR